MIIKLQGIVLRNQSYGESDHLLFIFSRERGKVSMIVRGSKKPRSRFGAVTEPFTIADFVCYQHSPTSMPSLSQADIIHHHQTIRSDLLLTAYGAYWLELVDRIIVEKEPSLTLYNQLGMLLSQLNDGKDPEILTRLLELAILTAAGYKPVFSGCANCGTPWQNGEAAAFSLAQGGMVCTKCMTPRDISITPATAYYLRILNDISADQLGNVNIKWETKRDLETILQYYLDAQLDIKTKSRAILQQLRSTWN
ncbi:DNA repair protein RecO [Shimazuella sp. AN120528]|uniref:DNA repair protein RecO n=1 Tax=Shimazuella soli TaxID=1892854 RepID=UPI001F0E4B14|nr:DNA repair protein RecO [Shimazuella soli]MCH5583882.1 DNA repair protein RecO [Shimazuella soli]